ncbi:MAG: hypothetical protein ACXIUM_01350 [Wenzhouxiangella sp.]
MKIRIVLMAALVSGMVSGCASLESGERRGLEVQGEHVAAVERAADQQGVEVIWINPPQKQRTRDIEWHRSIEVRMGEDPKT